MNLEGNCNIRRTVREARKKKLFVSNKKATRKITKGDFDYFLIFLAGQKISSLLCDTKNEDGMLFGRV